MKGIYPREPKRKWKGTNKTYYHVKDIKYLEQDKIMDTWRECKIFERKFARLMSKGEKKEAYDLWLRRPKIEYQALIKERYPSFVDCLRDLDDALCLIFLYSKFPAHEFLGVERKVIKLCQKLAYEFMLYCTATKSFKKVFLSIKGIYYQAEIMGQSITWVVPYQFTQKMPFDIDYNVMDTFLDFYRALMRFVNYKLYNDVGLTYPPERMDLSSKDASKLDQKKVKQMQDIACERLYGNEAKDKQDISEEFMKTPEYAQLMQKEDALSKLRTLFNNKVFFLNREVPLYSLEFIIPAFGGAYGFEGESSKYALNDKQVTHHVMDRNPNDSLMQFSTNRDFIVPQWIYDCINHQILLPVVQYKPGSPPPPHLSPFVDNKAEGYIPKRQEEINEMKGITEEVFEPEIDNESDMEVEEEQEQGKKQNQKYDDDSSSESDNEEDEKQAEKKKKMTKKLKESLEKERKELGKLMMTKKQRRLYGRINYSLRRKKDFVTNLKDKRADLERNE